MRTRILLLTLLAMALTISLQAADVRDEIAGHWIGGTMCNVAVSADCYNDTASYRISPTDDPRVVSIAIDRIRNGFEETLGVLRFTVMPSTRVLLADYIPNDRTHLRWELQWDGSRMSGTVTNLRTGAVVRSIAIRKQ